MTFKAKLLLLALCALFCAGAPGIAGAVTLTCTSGGNFGTVNTQATISGPNNLVMDPTGAITYPGTITGPGTGTPITCTIAGAHPGNKAVDVSCDASRIITNNGGCCGNANLNATGFTVSGTNGANSSFAPAACRGLGTTSGTFTTSNTGTLNLGITIDATHPRIGGTYQLSNNAAGVVNIQIVNFGSTVNSSANFSVVFGSLVGFSSVSDLDFGKIAFTSQPTSADHIDLGTDSSATYAGSFSSQGGALAAGQVTMNNVQNGVTVEVRCDTATTMTNGAGKSIQVTGLKVAAEGSTGSYSGAGTACAGSGAASPAATMVYNAGSRDQFFLGGKLDGGTASPGFVNGTYSTANAGGVYAVVTVINQ